MTVKQKWILSLSISIGFTSIFVALILYFMFYPKVPRYVIEALKNDEIYHRYSGSISAIAINENNHYLLAFDNVKAEDKNDLNLDDFYDSYLTIYSDDSKSVWEQLNPEIGLEISFMATFFQNKYSPIVQITVRDVEILSFEEGKNAFIEWVKTGKYV